MAESTSAPALPSTADPIPYVPVSWMAVAALMVAAIYIAVMVALGASAFYLKKPLVQVELLVLPAVGVVLCFAARRVIRNSEGTRTGENLANTAWWICVIGGLGYAAYLLAIDYAIRRDAKAELEKWMDSISAGDERGLNWAFLHTREPNQRAGIPAEDTAQVKGRFYDEYVAFAQCDLVRIARRNKADCQFVPGAVKEWSYRTGGIECTFTGVMKCPEGRFPLIIALRGIDSTAAEGLGRQWGIHFNPTGNFIARDQQSLTRYGWLMAAMEEAGGAFGNQFIVALQTSRATLPYLYHTAMMETPVEMLRFWHTSGVTAPGRMAVAGGLSATRPYTADYLAYSFPDKFFRDVGGAAPTPEKRKTFADIWEAGGMLPAGARLRNSADTHSSVHVTDTAVEVRVPCELPFVGQDAMSAARGRLVLVSTDPKLLSEIKQLRQEANPDAGSSLPPQELRGRDFKWRVVRLESDLNKVVTQPRPGEPGGPPAPPPVTP
jgi:hypothetical protein